VTLAKASAVPWSALHAPAAVNAQLGNGKGTAPQAPPDLLAMRQVLADIARHVIGCQLTQQTRVQRTLDWMTGPDG